MQKNYEVIYVFAGSKSPEDAKAHKEVFVRNLEKFDAKIIEEQEWGRRTLAYPIKGETAGYYYLTYFSTESTKLQDLIKSFKVLPKGVKVLRSLINEMRQEEFDASKHLQGEIETPDWYTKEMDKSEDEEVDEGSDEEDNS